MTETLVPYREFTAEDLADRLHTIASESREALERRNLRGVVARYAVSGELAEKSVRDGQRSDYELGLRHLAVVDSAGNVRGAAYIKPGLELRKMIAPVPPEVPLLGRLGIGINGLNPKVAAWTDDPQLLFSAYTALQARALRSSVTDKSTSNPWTIEPAQEVTEETELIHLAIKAAGFCGNVAARFDDGESGRRIPPVSILYTSTALSVLPDPQSLAGRWGV